MKNIHVDDVQEQILRVALAGYAEKIREEARNHRGGYSPRAVDLHVLRINVEALIDSIANTVVEPKAPLVFIDSLREQSESLAA